MKIFVTGANGYIGTQFVRIARGAGHSIVAATRRPPASETDRRDWVPFEIDSTDIQIPTDVQAIVHLAADTSGHPDSSRELKSAERLLTAMPRNARFLFVSSQTARAEAPTSYGRTKWQIEQIVLKSGGVIVRPGQVYGGYEKAMFGTLASAARKLPVLPAFFPAPLIQPIHVEDCAFGILRALETGVSGQIYTLADSHPVSFNFFLRQVAENFNRRPRLVVPVPRFLITAMAQILGENVAQKTGLSRLASLFKLPILDSAAADLDFLKLSLRPLADGLQRSGRGERRRLLREGRAFFTYILDAAPSAGLLRSYVKMIEALNRGPALTIRPLFLKCPALFALIEGGKKSAFQEEFRWRLDAATLLAEASPIGAQRFLTDGNQNGFWSAALGIFSAVVGEVMWRTLRLIPGVRHGT